MGGSKSPVIALTGSIGSGKSTVLALWQQLGASVFSADSFARDVTAPGTVGLDEIAAVFGPDIIQSDGTLDRKKLGRIVFDDARARERLEAIVHPKIRDLWQKALSAVIQKSPRLVVYEIPLYFETGARYPEIEKVVSVYSDESTVLQRLRERDGHAEDEARKRLRSQLPPEEKAARADLVIRNTGTLEDLKLRATEVFHDLCR